MGDSYSHGCEIDAQIRADQEKQDALERKRKANAVRVNNAITELLDLLDEQQLTRQTWDAVRELEKSWFGKEGR